MSNPKKPPTLKVICGTERPSRRGQPKVELPILSSVPPAPAWLPNAHAKNEWDRLARILTANKLLTQAGTSSLAILCAVHGMVVEMFEAGKAPTGHLIAQYRNLANDFGLTPVAQGKVRPAPAGKEADANPFARNGLVPGGNGARRDGSR
ncbi:MAG: hypothetical protein WB870_09435 [Gallionellaceae bacterium]